MQAEAIKYCENDCFLLYTIIKRFQLETVELYKTQNSEAIFDMLTNLTAAQMSFNVFRKIFQKDGFDLVIPENNKELEYIRLSYRGALCEVYRPETPQGWITAEFDLNSEYPNVMRNRFFPTGEGKYVDKLFFEKNKNKIYYYDEEKREYSEFFGFAQGRVDVPKSIYAPYLYIHTKKRGNVAPTGTFGSVWPSEDLIYASEIGTQILHLEDGFHYDKTNNIFKAFVDFHYPIRIANKNNPRGKLTKLILNSLYGKTGQKLVNRVSMCVSAYELALLTPIMKNIRIHIEIPDIQMFYISFDRSLNLNTITKIIKDDEFSRKISRIFNYYTQRDLYWNNNSLPHIAAFITAYARQDIHRLGMSVKHGIWNATDTDALHISFNLENPKHKAEFEYFLSLCGNNIGELKHVGTFCHVKFFAPKVYARYDENGKLIPELSRFAGIEPQFREIVFNNITSQGVSIEYEKIISKDMKHLTHNVEKVTQNFTLEWNKRILTEDGKNSRPLHYPDDFNLEERIF